jgi:protein-export membrane protein SecD/preprotein translocase SecF subunit
MGEKDLWLKLGLIVMIVALSISFIYPPDKLKPGIDLGGGYSLLFEIDDSGDTRPDLAARVMDILKQRVDPGGNRNLVWRPIGRNRLEIQMPRVAGDRENNRAAYDAARKVIAGTQITRSQIISMTALPADQRQAAIDTLVGSVASRRALFKTLCDTADQYQKLDVAQSQPAGTTQPAASTQPMDEAKARQMDDLFKRRNEAIDKLMATNLNPQVLSDILDLDPTSTLRKQKIAQIYKDHEDLKSAIDHMVATYNVYSKEKGFLDDPSDLMRLLRGAGELEFRIIAERDSSTGRLYSTKPDYQERAEKYTDQLAKFGPRPQAGDNYQWFEISKPEENHITTNPSFVVADYLGVKYVLAHSTPDMGLLNTGKNDWKLRRAMVGRDRAGAMAVDFELDARGGNKFATLTGENIKRPLGIFLDKKAVSAPTLQSQISTNGQITGRFTPQEVQSLVNTLEAGVLPARLKEVPLQEKGVGPALGNTNRTKGITATAIALVVTLAFMAIYYTYCGFIADIALILNFVITLGAMSFLGCTFTLPGIAGLILTLGMAVDANVLIYERMREEMQRGVSVRMAVRLGYEKAFSAILDGNVTTIITAVILAYLGSEEIKGFGQTLGIGLCISMFTALFVTRQYFNIMTPTSLAQEETRKTWVATAVVALLGGAFMGLGWVLNRAPGAWENSSLFAFGKFLGIVFGTAVVLIGSMWAFRWVYKFTGHQRGNRMPMIKLLTAPKVDWMGKRHIFWACSAVVVVGGLFFSWQKLEFDTSTIMDIEFIGGTSVQVEMQPKYKDMKDEALGEHIVGKGFDDPKGSVGWLHKAGSDVANAKVTKIDDLTYNVVPATPLTTSQMQALLSSKLGPYLARNGVTAAETGVRVQLDAERSAGKVADVQAVQGLLKDVAVYADAAAQKLRSPKVQSVQEKDVAAFEIITTETNKQLVAEALLASLGNYLQVQQPVEYKLFTDPARATDGLFPVHMGDQTLADVLGREAAGAGGEGESEDIKASKGGVLLVFSDLHPSVTVADVEGRIRQMQLQPDMDAVARDRRVIGLTRDPADPADTEKGKERYTRIAVAVADPMHAYVEEGTNQDWHNNLADKELKLAEAALNSSRALQRVTQFAPQVASEAAIKAVIAVIISLIAIAIYMWARFGSAEFGLSGIIALYHDVAVALSAVVFSHVVYDTWFGRAIGLQDFRIDLSVIAALLTIIGFSINDTIVIFDRIRENRGRTATVSHELVNRSLNETMSRTIITTFTVLLTVLVMYVFGGDGIHAFAFTMLVGCISGTYSTIAIATPMVNAPRAMWLTTIILSALTMLGLVAAVESPVMETVLIVAILAITAYGIYRIVRQGRPMRQAVESTQA